MRKQKGEMRKQKREIRKEKAERRNVIIVVIANQAIYSSTKQSTCLLVYLSTKQKKESRDISVTGPWIEKRRLPTLPHCIAVPSA